MAFDRNSSLSLHFINVGSWRCKDVFQAQNLLRDDLFIFFCLIKIEGGVVHTFSLSKCRSSLISLSVLFHCSSFEFRELRAIFLMATYLSSFGASLSTAELS